MSEQLRETIEDIERLTLADVEVGDTIEIVTGEGDQAWRYSFSVTDNSTIWPKGRLMAITPDGTQVDEEPFELHGAGKWTTREQNPVQDQERGFTSYFDSLFRGGFMVGLFEGESDRSVFDKPRQEISQIRLRRQ